MEQKHPQNQKTIKFSAVGINPDILQHPGENTQVNDDSFNLSLRNNEMTVGEAYETLRKSL